MNKHSVLKTVGMKTSLQTVETPRIHQGELLVEPRYVGICGTDLQIIRRQRSDPATILGHEGIAYILEGSNTKEGMQAGHYVVFNPVDPTDQNQILGHNTPGLLQKRRRISHHAIEYDLVVPFPDGTDPALGALVEPLGTVVYGHNLVSKVVRQSSIAIVGAGAIGIMHALYAKAQGYEKILLINASEEHLDWCVQRGIVAREDTFLDSDNLASEILAATSGAGVDAVYMCTSRPNALKALSRALLYIKEGGCIDLVGGIKDHDQLSDLPKINDLNAVRRANFCGIPSRGYVEKTRSSNDKEVYITGHRGTSIEHFNIAIKNLSEHGDIFSKVISHTISLEAAADLFNQISKGPVKAFNGTPYIKAVVDMRLAGKVIKNV